MPGYGASLTSAGVIFTPRTSRKRRGLILCHGAGSDGTLFTSGTAIHGSILAAVIASAGIPCIATALGGPNTWGYDTVVQSGGDVDTAWAALQAATSIASDKLLMLGISMGTSTTFRYMATQPAKCAAGVVILPLVNMGDFYGNNRGGYQTSVAGGWGVTAPAALPTRADPSSTDNVSAIATSGPLRGFYSTADLLMTPSLEPTFAAAVNAAGGSADFTVCDTVNGHSDLSTGLVDIPTVVQFLIANGA